MCSLWDRKADVVSKVGSWADAVTEPVAESEDGGGRSLIVGPLGTQGGIAG